MVNIHYYAVKIKYQNKKYLIYTAKGEHNNEIEKREKLIKHKRLTFFLFSMCEAKCIYDQVILN